MNVNRFPRVGQNTPLTCVYMNGFEFNDQARDKLQSASGYANAAVTPHQNGGSGGSRYGTTSNSTGFVTLAIPPLREFVICSAVYFANSTGVGNMSAVDSGGGAAQLVLNFTASTGVIVAKRNTTTLATSAASSFATGSWNWVHWWGNIDDSVGFSHTRIGSWANEVLSITGVDTKNTANTTFDLFQGAAASASAANYDDLMIFARSMYYHGASGSVPAVGATITGGTSGATAVITNVFDNGAGSGCYFVRTVTGAFQAAETISSGGWSGTTGNALANDQDSLWFKEQYIFTRAINGDIATGWTSSTGVAHYTEVDDAATTTDFVSTNTANQVDEFSTTGSLPPGAEIGAVTVSVYARLNGVSTVNNIRPGMDDGAADIDADADSPLSGSWEVHDLIFTNNPNTGTKYTTTEIGNLHPRITSKA